MRHTSGRVGQPSACHPPPPASPSKSSRQAPQACPSPRQSSSAVWAPPAGRWRDHATCLCPAGRQAAAGGRPQRRPCWRPPRAPAGRASRRAHAARRCRCRRSSGARARASACWACASACRGPQAQEQAGRAGVRGCGWWREQHSVCSAARRKRPGSVPHAVARQGRSRCYAPSCAPPSPPHLAPPPPAPAPTLAPASSPPFRPMLGV